MMQGNMSLKKKKQKKRNFQLSCFFKDRFNGSQIKKKHEMIEKY